jgi:trans-aconitate methyltransferase
LLSSVATPSVVLDIGCGYGVPGCWVLEQFPKAQVYGIDPDRERIRVAARVFADRGSVRCDLAPNIPLAPEAADLAFLLDMIHFLDDAALGLTLRRLRSALRPNGLLIIRAVILPPDDKRSWYWHFDAIKMKIAGTVGHYRPVEHIVQIIAQSGFESRHRALSGDNPESAWIIAAPLPGEDFSDPSSTLTQH